MGSSFSISGARTTATQTQSLADQTTGWQNTLRFQQFDPRLGTLLGVNLTLTDDVKGQQKLTSTQAGATVITADQAATVDLRLGATTLLSTSTALSNSVSLDGNGSKSASLSHSDSSQTTDTSGTDLKAFTGTGQVTLGADASGTSSVNGPGNMIIDLAEQAGATVDVSYTYLPTQAAAADPAAVPEPASGALVLSALTLWRVLARRRRGIAPPR